MSWRAARLGAGVLLVAAGALMGAASWQRWAGVCAWGQDEGGACLRRQDHLYDFIAPTTPWQPVGHAAELAGASLLLAALALALLPWALIGRRPGRIATGVLMGAVLAQTSVGATTLVSGLSGEVVRPVVAALAVYLWILWPPALLIRFGFSASGWARAACVVLLLASPLVAALSYSQGSYDARPWWEAVSGVLTSAAGVCLLAGTARNALPAHRDDAGRQEDTDALSSPARARDAPARD